MTIDEAIVHAKEKALQNREYAEENKGLENTFYYDDTCIQCAEEHEQLAEWLEELKALREKDQQLIHLTQKEFDVGTQYTYNKAIDDFNCYVKHEEAEGNIKTLEDYDRVAAQLKEGKRMTNDEIINGIERACMNMSNLAFEQGDHEAAEYWDTLREEAVEVLMEVE